ncbi:DUF3000 domain-containing protein [Nocardioides sp.]|uniref:DUF3000 domain-containing protein n=1 Tax=Nocardioides sp. TaxID=35761 RepID=UPI0035159031
MVARHESNQGPGAPSVPRAFSMAVDSMRRAVVRPEVLLEEMPAPQRIAPYASAISADVTVDGDDVATGRLVLLHDPAGNDAWEGEFRCVAYCRAEVDEEISSDPMLTDVAWSWLLDALGAHGAEHVAVSGTVTRVSTDSFGTMAGEPGSAQVEVRASWTPLDVADLATHVEAWAELLCTAGGLEPVPDGVAVMPSRRGQRGELV